MIQQITGHTVLCGLLGSPVSHSISPMMHNEAFAQLGLDYAYLAFDVDTDNLKTAVEGLRILGVRGFNVTMPDKNMMTKLVDKLTPAAQLTGAVNTVINDNGVLTGHTTDGIGYMLAAKDAGYDLTGKKMTLLGAGGAATSILVQAALDGLSEIHVFNIKDQFFGRTEILTDKLNNQTSCKVVLHDLKDTDALNESILNSDILTNGTSVGMAPNTENCIIKDPSVFRPELIVSDVIYNPKETLLLKMAKKAGCPTFNGMYMLLYQGAEAFKLWTGKEMPIDIIKEKFFS
ncbi:MAG: shikimate dehydrogenase [Lachnospiraceae bacterium]|nr:shikimate dehydrogenase [Lachnospiraceae bacterium]